MPNLNAFFPSPLCSIILFVGIGFALGILKKGLTGEGALPAEVRLEANRQRAAGAVRRMEKAFRRMRRARLKAELLERINDPWLLASVQQDARGAIRDARYAQSHIKAVLHKARVSGLHLSANIVAELIERERSLQDFLDSASAFLRILLAGANTWSKHAKIQTAEDRIREDILTDAQAARTVLARLSELAREGRQVLREITEPILRYDRRFQQTGDATIYGSGGLLRDPFKPWAEQEVTDTITTLRLQETKSDLRRVGVALDSLEGAIEKAETALASNDLLESCYIRDILIGWYGPAMERMDEAIGDVDLPLPSKLSVCHSALVSSEEDETTTGVLDLMQHELEALEYHLCRLYTALRIVTI